MLLPRLISLVAVLLFISACSTNPVTGKREIAMSESWEISAGAKYHQGILKEYTVYNDPVLQAYVDSIGQRLAKTSHRSDLPFTFTLLDSPQVNAFALPGGYVYITRGIMAYMTKEAHLAGVIGHEIGHVTGRHGAQRAAQQQIAGVGSAAAAILTGSNQAAQLSQVLGGALLSGYGRTQELQSDRLGAEYIAKNNYPVDDMIGVIGILKNQELYAAERAREAGREPQGYHGLFASHPRNDTRLQEVIKAADKYRDTGQPIADDGEFLRLTDGMAYGETESQGITRGNKFYHKDLNLFIEFPEGWNLQNSANQFAAVAPDGNQAIIMQMDTLQDQPAQYLSAKFPGFRDGRNLSTSEDQAYAGVATVTSGQQQQNVRVSAVARGDQAFVFTGLGKDALPNQAFFDVTESVRRLKPSEKKLATGRKIRLVRAKSGDTIASLAKKSNLDDQAQAQLRLINDLYPQGEPKAGQMIKIIE